MGLYNMVFGNDPRVGAVLLLLEKESAAFGRFRDAWIEKTEAGELRLAVYTRNGGNNRGEYMPDWCAEHPLFISDKDDDFDNTYATIYFKMPEDALAKLRALGFPEDATLEDLASPEVDMSARWLAAIEALKTGPLSKPE